MKLAKMMEKVFMEKEFGEDGFLGSSRLLAHSYIPWQHYKKAFSPERALMKGTLFPELFGVYRIPK